VSRSMKDREAFFFDDFTQVLIFAAREGKALCD